MRICDLCFISRKLSEQVREDDGRAILVGGYDADDRPSHNTAWVAKATLPMNSEPKTGQP